MHKIQEITAVTIPFKPSCLLLNNVCTIGKNGFKKLISNLFTIARIVVFKFWKRLPDIIQWESQCWYSMIMNVYSHN